MSWTAIRVSKYNNRALHPDDHQPGLPKPGILESADRYATLHVRRDGVAWVGRGYANEWLQSKDGYYAEPTETETTSVQAETNKRKPRRKPKVLPE